MAIKDSGKSAFVTGGSGFVGSHLVECLLKNGYDDIRCLIRKEQKWLTGLPITPIFGELDNAKSLASALEGVDYVYHVGGLTRSKNTADFYKANVAATLQLMDTLLKVNPSIKKVLVTSSMAAVGGSGDEPLREDAPLNPLTQYGASKAQMEQALVPYFAKIPTVIIRPPAVYGEREADLLEMFKGVKRGIFARVGRGDVPHLNLVYVKDLVKGMVQAAESQVTSGQIYSLGSPMDYSWNEIRDEMAKAMDKKVLTVPIPAALMGLVGGVVETVGGWFGQYPPLNREKAKEAQSKWRFSIEKAQKDFAYSPDTPLSEGFRNTVGWYQEKGWI